MRLACFHSLSARVRLFAIAILDLVAESAGVGPMAAASVRVVLVESTGCTTVSPIAITSVTVELALVESTGFVRVSPRVELAEAVHNLETEHSAALMAVVKQVAAWRTNA